VKRIAVFPHYKPSDIPEGFMSAMSDSALSVAKPTAMPLDCTLVPLLGVLWVVVNVSLLGLGTYIHLAFACSFVVGLVNGTVLSVIAVAVASEKFQASTAGLLGGLSLSGLRSDGSMIAKAMQNLHTLADSVLNAMGIEVNEQVHRALEQEAVYMVWTTLFVVLASLVAEWVRSSRPQVR
jgi:hypothetical protein